ncbi:hypothetical protein GQ54DRAFT_111811 [Martensiomyces pterosporus]|nr:hypothetical protein GQ54DRAFT_111811 [Martensiomyces pterosporus]
MSSISSSDITMATTAHTKANVRQQPLTSTPPAQTRDPLPSISTLKGYLTPFSGALDEKPARDWAMAAQSLVDETHAGHSEARRINTFRALLAGDARKYSQDKDYTTLTELLADLERAFPLTHNQNYTRQQVHSRRFFDGIQPHYLANRARLAFRRSGETDADAYHIAETLATLQPAAWMMTATRPIHVTAANFDEKIDKFAMFVEALPDTLHSAPAPAHAPPAVETPRSGQPAAASNPALDTRSSKRRAARKALLLTKINRLTLKPARTAFLTFSPSTPQLSGSAQVAAVADSGAQVSLITAEAARRIGLAMGTDSHPLLKPLWDAPPYRCLTHDDTNHGKPPQATQWPPATAAPHGHRRRLRRFPRRQAQPRYCLSRGARRKPPASASCAKGSCLTANARQARPATRFLRV